jgi:hypothetical protein
MPGDLEGSRIDSIGLSQRDDPVRIFLYGTVATLNCQYQAKRLAAYG